MTKMENLLAQRMQLSNRLAEMEEQIHNYDDGYQHVVVVNEFKVTHKKFFTNFVAACEYASFYTGDSEANVYTTCPNPRERHLIEGNIYYVPSINLIGVDGHPKETPTLLYAAYSSRMA